MSGFLRGNLLHFFRFADTTHSKHPSQEQLDDHLLQLTNRAIDALQHEDFRCFSGMLLWPLHWLTPPIVLRWIWTKVTTSLGTLHTSSRPQMSSGGFFPSTRVALRFRKLNLGMKLTFTKHPHHPKVIGFHIVPLAVLGLAHPWQPPSYGVQAACVEKLVDLPYSRVWPSIKGMLTVPMSASTEPNKKYPVLLLLPGSGSSSSLDEPVGALKPFADLTLGLVSQGYAVLRLHKPAVRGFVKQWVTGTVTVEDEYLAPALTGLNFLMHHPSIDVGRVYVLGHSQGAGVAPRICKLALARKINIRGMVCLATPARSLIEIVLAQSRWMGRVFPPPTGSHEEQHMLRETADLERICRDLSIIAEEMQQSRRELGRYGKEGRRHLITTPTVTWWTPWRWRHLPRHGPLGIPLMYLLDDMVNDPVGLFRSAELQEVPVLFMQGMQDFQVSPTDDFEKLKLGLQDRKNITFKQYNDLNHCFVEGMMTRGPKQYDEPGNVDRQVVEDIVKWLKTVS